MVPRGSRLALFLSLSVLVACPRQESINEPLVALELEEHELLLSRLERLVFVPPRSCRLATEFRSVFVDCSNARPLLVERFEVTEGEWDEWLDTLPEEERPPSISTRLPGPLGMEFAPSLHPRESDRLPARFMNFDEAARFAAWREMRLPTAREWFRVAAGTGVRRWPWGSYEAYGVANTLELSLESPTPVGVFERGASPLGIYDLIGNVAEWVDGEWEQLSPSDTPEPAGEMTWAAGGSSLTRLKRLVDRGAANAQLLHRRHRGSDVGLRLFADAETFLALRVGPYGDLAASTSEDKRRLEALGALWGRDALPVLRSLRRSYSEDGVGSALEALERGASGPQ